MSGVTIGPARPEDGTGIVHLLTASGLPPDGVLDHLHTAVVARRAGRVVACAALEVYGDGALLRSVAVDPAERGTGLGRAVTEAALALASRLGADPIFLLTTTAERYFPRFGFSIVPRSEVPRGVLQSIEFRSLCPASSTVMRRWQPGARRTSRPGAVDAGGT
jgi:amino-acid N-acetyltransferase